MKPLQFVFCASQKGCSNFPTISYVKMNFLANTINTMYILIYIYCYSIAKSCPIHYNSIDCSTPGFPVLHYLLEFTQTFVHWVGDAIQPSHHIYIKVWFWLIGIKSLYLYGLSPKSSLDSILASSDSGSSCVSLQHKTVIYVNVGTDSIFKWQCIIKNSFHISTGTGYKIKGCKITWGETQVSWILKSIPVILSYSQA